MRRLLPLFLVLATLSPALPADGDADDRAIRQLVAHFFDAVASKDLDGYMALWSEKSPDFDGARQGVARLFAETGPIEVKSVTVIRVERHGKIASVRVRVVLAGDDLKTRLPHPGLGQLERVLDLMREVGAWKVVRYDYSSGRLMERLVNAPTRAERLRILDDDSDLIGPDFVQRMLEQGYARAQRGEFDLPSRLYALALEIAEGMGDRDTLGNCWLYRGMLLDERPPYAAALASYQKARRLFHEANDREQEWAALNHMGLVYESLGRYPEALQEFQESLPIIRDIGGRYGEAQTLNDIGIVYDDMGRYDEALQQYQDSLRIARVLGDGVKAARALGNIGLVYDETGRYAEALLQYQDSLKMQRNLGDRAAEGRTLGNIGVVYNETGRYAEALQQYQESLKIARDLGDRHDEAQTLINIGNIHRETGRYAQALQQYQDGLAITRDIGYRDGEAAALTNMGSVYRETGRYAEALQQYQDGLAIARNLGDRAGQAIDLLNVGLVYGDAGRYAEALEQIGNSLEIAQSIDDLDGRMFGRNALGLVYQAQKRWNDAAKAYREAVGLTEQLRTNTREPSLQTSLLAQKTNPFFYLAQCLLELNQPLDALATAEEMKARALVDILRHGKADLRRGMSDDERKEEQRLQNDLTALGVQLENVRSRKTDAQAVAAMVADLDKARQDYDAFRRDLYLHRPDLQTRRAEFAPASLGDLSRSLFADRPGLVVLSYLVGKDETILFVLTAGQRDGDPARLTVHRIDVGAKDLAEAVGAFREGCSDPAKGEPDSDDLYRWLIAPAADELAGARQVVVVPDGVLHTLPFQALKGPNDKYLIEHFPVSYAPSVTALDKMEELGAKRRQQYAGQPPSLLAVGISDFGHREKSLPAAEQEARTVAGAFGDGAKLLPGTEATLARVEASWSGRRYLHFATHGRLNPDAPMYSSLVLSPDGDEGVLYARDLLDADVPAELVVMSACHTGEGKHVAGEGLLGMTWSWFAAGVPSAVASQWSVGDASTARLMKVFYARLAAGDSKAEALRQAELALLNDPATRHPFYWAPFVLVGDDR